MLRVGFVGLGAIGKPMALRLAAAEGIELTVFDREPQPLAALEEAGAWVASSVAEIAARVQVLCVMVRDDDQVRDVLGQVLAASPEELVFVIHATVAPDTPAQLADTAARHDVRVLDAPVSGGPQGAAEGSLAVMVGGDEASVALARPALEAIGSLVVHAGAVGAGTRFKLARNLLHFASFTAATEAQRLAEAAGLDLRDLARVVRHTDAITGGPGAVMLRETTAPVPAGDPWYDLLGHVVALGEKDLSFALELADDLAVELPLARLARERLAEGLGVPSASPAAP